MPLLVLCLLVIKLCSDQSNAFEGNSRLVVFLIKDSTSKCVHVIHKYSINTAYNHLCHVTIFSIVCFTVSLMEASCKYVMWSIERHSFTITSSFSKPFLNGRNLTLNTYRSG